MRETAVCRVASHCPDAVAIGRISWAPRHTDAGVLGQPGRKAGCAMRVVGIPDDGEAAGQVASQVPVEGEA